jgi:hypothetical protein
MQYMHGRGTAVISWGQLGPHRKHNADIWNVLAQQFSQRILAQSQSTTTPSKFIMGKPINPVQVTNTRANDTWHTARS